MKKLLFSLILATSLASCVSLKTTIRNIDDNAPAPKLKGDAFVLTQKSEDPKYGYDPDYPVNVYYLSTKNDTINAHRFLNGLAGPNGQKLFYKKVDTCCPFSTKRSEMGAGFIDLYEVTWVGQPKPVTLYINSYAKGAVLIPFGFTGKTD